MVLRTVWSGLWLIVGQQHTLPTVIKLSLEPSFENLWLRNNHFEWIASDLQLPFSEGYLVAMHSCLRASAALPKGRSATNREGMA